MGFDPVTVGLVISAVGAVGSFVSAQKQAGAASDAANAQRQQAQLAQRQADINNARQARATIRQARIARAAVANSGANAGTLSSSGVLGGEGSIGSQLSSNLGYFGQMKELNSQITAAQGQQADAMVAGSQAAATGAEFGALGSLGGTIFSGASGLKSLFDQAKK